MNHEDLEDFDTTFIEQARLSGIENSAIKQFEKFKQQILNTAATLLNVDISEVEVPLSSVTRLEFENPTILVRLRVGGRLFLFEVEFDKAFTLVEKIDLLTKPV